MGRIVFDRPIAHRGLHDRTQGVIENSRTAFELAAAGGYAIECDLQLSADGVPMVFHDRTLKRLVGRAGDVSGISATELQRMPLIGSASGDCPQRFGQLLDQIAGRTLLVVELKPQVEPAANAALAKVAVALANAYAGPLVLESFSPHLLREIRREGFNGPLGIATERFEDRSNPEIAALSALQLAALRGLWHWPLTRFDFISADKAALDLPVIRFCRWLGMPISSWTIRSAEEAKTALRDADQIVFEGFVPQSG